jgi:hypothetical protein
MNPTAGASVIQQGANFDQFFADFRHHAIDVTAITCFAKTGAEMSLGAFDREFFFVKQVLDGSQKFDIFFSIKPLAFFGSFWAKQGKLSFPESQHIGGDAYYFAHFTDFEKQFVGRAVFSHHNASIRLSQLLEKRVGSKYGLDYAGKVASKASRSFAVT